MSSSVLKDGSSGCLILKGSMGLFGRLSVLRQNRGGVYLPVGCPVPTLPESTGVRLNKWRAGGHVCAALTVPTLSRRPTGAAVTKRGVPAAANRRIHGRTAWRGTLTVEPEWKESEPGQRLTLVAATIDP